MPISLLIATALWLHFFVLLLLRMSILVGEKFSTCHYQIGLKLYALDLNEIFFHCWFCLSEVFRFCLALWEFISSNYSHLHTEFHYKPKWKRISNQNRTKRDFGIHLESSYDHIYLDFYNFRFIKEKSLKSNELAGRVAVSAFSTILPF